MERRQCVSGKFCYNINCAFDHPPDRIAPIPPTAVDGSNKKKSKQTCNFGDSCIRKVCKFSHPKDVLTDVPIDNVNEPEETKSSTEKSVDGSNKKKKKKDCNFGDNCTRKDCTFSHPKEETKSSSEKSVDGSNIKKKKKDCKFGDNCKRKDCTFSHPKHVFIPKTPSDGSKKDCKFGDNCKRKDCRFSHRKDEDSEKMSNGTMDSSICVLGPKCPDFYCPDNHPTSRPRRCPQGKDCERSNCKFLHPEPRKGLCPQGVTCIVYECDFLHPPQRPFKCKRNNKCFRKSCNKLHPSKTKPECKNSDSCQIFGCTFSHSNTRNPPCKKGAKCQKLDCGKLHPPKAQPCENGSNCIDFACKLSHPEDRIRICSNRCKNPRCDFLHPPDWNIKLSSEQKIKSLRTLQEREEYRLNNKLPIYDYKYEIMSLLKKDKVLIITGPPGSGKSTQIPQYLAEEFPGLIVCSNPYSMITMLNAQKIASEFDNDQVGESVGYNIDCGKGFSGKKIQLIQDSVLVKNKIRKDPLLQNINVLIIDEADKRGVYTDLLISIAKIIREKRPDDFYVVVITSDKHAKKVSDLFFGEDSEKKSLDLPTKIYQPNEVEIPNDDLSNFDNLISAIMLAKKQFTEGNFLIFLPGASEITEAIKKLNTMTKNKYDCYALHAGSSTESLSTVLNFQKENPKIIFCTEIAESILQIPNVQVVIDLGLTTEVRYDKKKRLDVMEQTFISKEQRVLRKACVAEYENGMYISLYLSANLKEEKEPEILRLALETLLLQLKILNLNPITFPFLTEPRKEELISSYQILKEFDCLDDSPEQAITNKGKLFASLPFDLKSNNFVTLGHELYDEGESFAIIAAAISSLESLFTIARNEYKNNMIKENIMKKASKHNSDLELLYETFTQWFQSGNSQGPKCTKCSRPILKTKTEEGCRFCRVIFAQKQNLNNKSMDGILKIKNKVQQLLKRFPSKEKKDPSITFTEKIAKCLINSFPELIGELILPENPSIGVHLLNGGEKGSFSPTSTFLQKSQKNLNFLIAMSLTNLRNGYVVLDHVHPILTEWIPESIMKKFESTKKEIQQCVTFPNYNGKYKAPLIKEIKKTEKANKWASYTIVNYEDNNLQVYGPKSYSKEIEVFCKDVISKHMRVETEQEISFPICNGTAVVSIGCGMTIKKLQPGTNTQIRFLLENNINTKEEFIKWLCEKAELTTDDIKWCNIFKGKNKAFSVVGFEDEASVQKAFKVKNATFNYSNDEISKTTCLKIFHDNYDFLAISQKLKAMENPPISISEHRPSFFQIIIKKISPEYKQNNGNDLKVKLSQDLKDLKSVHFSKDISIGFLKFLSNQARDEAMLKLSQNPFSKETIYDDDKQVNHLLVVKFSKVTNAQNFSKNTFKEIFPEAISCEGFETVRVKKAHLFQRLDEFLVSISSKYNCTFEIDKQKNKFSKQANKEPFTKVIFKGAPPIIVGKASKDLLKIIAPLSIRFPTKQQKALIKEIDDLNLFDQWDETLGLEHKTFEDDKSGDIFKLEVYGNQISQGVYMANILQYSDGFNARYQTIPVPNDSKFLFRKNRSGDLFLKKLNKKFKNNAIVSFEIFENLIQIYIKPKVALTISSIQMEVQKFLKDCSSEKENKNLDETLNPCVFCQKSGGQPFLICGHHYCSNCLANEIRNNCQNVNQLVNLECPECKNIISIKDLKFSMSDEDFQREAQNLAISFLSINNSFSMAPCPGYNCESLKLKNSGYSICNWCETESCALCGEQNNNYHKDRSCSERKEAQRLAYIKENMTKCLVQNCVALREKKYSTCFICKTPSCPVCGSENTPLHIDKTCHDYKEAVKKKFNGVDLPNIIQKAKKFIEDEWDSIQLGRPKRIEINPGLIANCPSMQKFCSAVLLLGENVLSNGFCAWHGTNSEGGVIGICYDGFDPSRRSGQAYGPGEYFGQASTASHSYAGNSNRMIVTFILKVPQVSTQGNFCYIVNNPKDFKLSFNLPVIVLNYKDQLPPIKFLGVEFLKAEEKIIKKEVNDKSKSLTFPVNNQAWTLIFRWFWLTDSRTFQPYNDHISLMIEKEFVLFQEGKRDHKFITPPITRFIDDVPQIYFIDFKEQLQINSKTGYERKIRRKNVDIPKSNAIWQFEDDNNVWKPFETLVQNKIEQAFSNYGVSSGSSRLTNLNFPGRPESYTIDFVVGIQINELSNTYRNIRRLAN